MRRLTGALERLGRLRAAVLFMGLALALLAGASWGGWALTLGAGDGGEDAAVGTGGGGEDAAVGTGDALGGGAGNALQGGTGGATERRGHAALAAAEGYFRHVSNVDLRRVDGREWTRETIARTTEGLRNVALRGIAAGEVEVMVARGWWVRTRVEQLDLLWLRERTALVRADLWQEVGARGSGGRDEVTRMDLVMELLLQRDADGHWRVAQQELVSWRETR